VVKIREESHLIKKVEIEPEQNSCSCGCIGQENVNLEETEHKLINQSQSE
jgi:hypothetical protein